MQLVSQLTSILYIYDISEKISVWNIQTNWWTHMEITYTLYKYTVLHSPFYRHADGPYKRYHAQWTLRFTRFVSVSVLFHGLLLVKYARSYYYHFLLLPPFSVAQLPQTLTRLRSSFKECTSISGAYFYVSICMREKEKKIYSVSPIVKLRKILE